MYGLPDATKFLNGPDYEALSLNHAIFVGVYPMEYTLRSCKVNSIFDGGIIEVGQFQLSVIETPGP